MRQTHRFAGTTNQPFHRVIAFSRVAALTCAAAMLLPPSTEAQMPQKTQSVPETAPPVTVIPMPAKLTAQPGAFALKADTVIVADPGVKAEAQYLAQVLAPATGFTLAVKDASPTAPKANCIILRQDSSRSGLGEEGYALEIDKDRVTVRALKPAGAFYAIQTIRQLLPPVILSTKKTEGVAWNMPCLQIEDVPRFAWRAQLLDCGRHFFPKEAVKRTIDLLALHKMNRLHWHLTEDQGWRIEIKKYPKLTSVGAWRIEKDGTRYGGYYSQADVKEIVAYAAARHIVIVPEIEMPGHSTAALASYPEFGCTGGPYQVANDWGVFKDVYCAGNDKTFEFLQNVLTEVMDLFPSTYIHIGGDECPKDRWKECPKCQERIKNQGLKNEEELQSYFIKRIDKFLTSKGRRLVGWDEILEGGLAPNAVVQSWRGIQGGITAAQEGHDVIMSPTTHCYLDYSYATTSLEKAYSYEPIPDELSGDKAKHVLGLEGNMWTEWVPNQDRLDFQVFPRLTALAEVAWSPKEKRNWDNFNERMKAQYRRFEVLGVKYGIDELTQLIEKSRVVGTWSSEEMYPSGTTLEYSVADIIDTPGVYTVIPLFTRGTAAVRIEWVALMFEGNEVVRDTHPGWSGIDKRDIVYKLEVEATDAGQKYTLQVHVVPQGGVDSSGEVRIIKP